MLKKKWSLSKFSQSISLIGDVVETASATSVADAPSNESDMESYARHLTLLADGLEQLPAQLRLLADQIRPDPANPPEAMTTQIRNITQVLTRLGQATNTMGNLQGKQYR